MILHDMILHDMILHGFCMTWFCMTCMVFSNAPVLRKGDADEEETNAVVSCVGATVKVAAAVQVAGEGAAVKVEGATVKVVQVEGATVKVAGHCASGVRWVRAKRALDGFEFAQRLCVRARPTTLSTGSPNLV